MGEKIDKSDVYRKYIFDEMSRKINREEKDPKDKEQKLKELEHYVDSSLSDHKAKKLCCQLSHDRKNPVFHFISRGPDQWSIKNVKISAIYMIGINGKVNRYLRENGWSLKENSKDKHIRRHKEFNKTGDIYHRCLTLIAQNIGSERYKLIDGNHRAVRLCINGARKIKLIYY